MPSPRPLRPTWPRWSRRWRYGRRTAVALAFAARGKAMGQQTRSPLMTAMRRVLVLAMLVLLASACGAPGRPAQPAWAPALPPARLVLSDATDEIQPWLGTLERAVEPTTLADVP